MIRCTFCGKNLPDDDAYCVYCGLNTDELYATAPVMLPRRGIRPRMVVTLAVPTTLILAAVARVVFGQ